MNQEERDLDQAIREKLEQFRPASPLNWDRMEQRLQAEADKQAQDNNDSFDKSIKNKISPHRIPFNPSHWRRMSARLDARAQWKTLLYRTKAIELGLMLLLFFTVYNFTPIFVAPETSTVSQNIDNQSINKEINKDIDENINQNKVPQNTYNNTYNTALQYPTDTYHDAQKSDVQSVVDINDQVAIEEGISFTSSNRAAVAPSAMNDDKAEKPPVFEDVELHEFITEKANLPSLTILPIDTKQIQANQKLAKVKARHIIAYVANVQYFVQFNRIKIPTGSNNIFLTDAQYALNQGFAINGGVVLGHNQLTSGIAYNSLTFASKSRATLTDGSAGIRERAVKMQTLSVPFNYAHTFNTGRFSPFVQLGVAAHFITKAKYDYHTVSYSRVAAMPPLAPTTPIPTLPDGLLNGGQWVNNAYMSADLGIGGTYKMTSHLSLISQIQYKHFMFNNGFGPNDNRINQLQMATGIQLKY